MVRPSWGGEFDTCQGVVEKFEPEVSAFICLCHQKHECRICELLDYEKSVFKTYVVFFKVCIKVESVKY